MKIKITLLAVFCAAIICNVHAQTSDAETDAIINLLGVQKKEAMAQLVHVETKDSAAFWNIYEEYQKENKVTAKARIRLYEKTAHAYSDMTPPVADSLASKYFSNRMEQEKSLEAYYQKIKTATNAVVAFEFYQAEVYMITQIRASIMQQIPTYGELLKASKRKK